MGLWLKQSTAVTVKIGPFIDDTDGKTAEAGLTLTQADIRLSKNSGNIAQKNEASNATTDELGYYDCPLDTTDTNTLGILQLFVHEAGALPVFHEYMVMPANVYNSLVLGSASDLLDVSAVQLNGDAQSLTDLKDLADTGYNPATHKVQGVVLTDTTTAVTNTVNLSVASEAQIDAIETDTNEIQGKLPTNKIMGSSVVTDKDDEIDAIKTMTDKIGTITNTGGTATLGAILGDFANSALVTRLNTIDDFLDSEIAAILADTNELQTDWANGGRLDLLIDAIKAITDTLTLAAIADAVHDEVTEGTTTLRQAIKLISSALFAKTSGGGTATLIAQDLADTKARITVTADADGNRTAVILDGA